MKKPDNIDYSRTHDITVDEVRACAIFAHLTDEQAQEVAETFKILSKIAYDSYKKEHQTHGNVRKSS